MPKPYPKEFRDDVVRVAQNREPGQHLRQIAADFSIGFCTSTHFVGIQFVLGITAMVLIDVVVSDIVQETAIVKAFHLVKPDGSPFGSYVPGGHIDVVEPTSITSQYWLCGSPDDGDKYAVAVKREEHSRGGFTALHELTVGDVLQISGQQNLLTIASGARHPVLVAAGIGVTQC